MYLAVGQWGTGAGSEGGGGDTNLKKRPCIVLLQRFDTELKQSCRSMKHPRAMRHLLLKNLLLSLLFDANQLQQLLLALLYALNKRLTLGCNHGFKFAAIFLENKEA